MTEELVANRSLEASFRRHHAALLRLAVVLTGDRGLADDLVQEAFLRLHRTRSWPRPEAELAYLRRTVVNLSHGHHRRLAVARRHAPKEVEVEAPGADVSAAAREQRRLVADAVRRLPTRQRDCVVLHYFTGLSDAEIATDLGIGVGSVKTHLHRARAALAEHLEQLR